MKSLKKTLLIILIIIIVLVTAGILIIRHINQLPLPDYSSNIKIESLTNEVTIYRDSFAIPHIIAENEKDLYIAVGYVLAQDRLWQMDLLRRATQGRLSEIFGDDLVNIDLLLRSLRIPHKSRIIIDTCDARVIAAMEAFATGVNEYINSNTKKLPVEFKILGYKPERWEAEHSVNLAGYMAWDLKSGWIAEVALHELRKKLDDEKFQLLIPDLGKQKSIIYPGLNISDESLAVLIDAGKEFNKLEKLGLHIFCGSNNWAVAGKKSISNKPVLANDMHLGLFVPGIWYQMHQVIEGELDVTGVVLPGQPFIISGHNDSIAWGMTNVMLDDIDFYLETLNEDSTKYKLNGKWKDLEVSKELIKSKSGRLFNKQIRYTHRGPIITDHKNITSDAISMAWTGYHFSNEIRSVYYLNRAGSWDAFKKAMSTFNSTSQNVVYADIEGNIGLYCCAGIPIRNHESCFISPGDTGLYDWKGLVPFEERPHVYNPEEGYVISANNNTVDDSYPYHISHWFHLPARYDRIKNMIEAKDELTIEDHKDIQNDFNSVFAPKVNSQFLDLLDSIENLSEIEHEALNILKSWEGSYHKDEIAPTLFETLFFTFLKNTMVDEIGTALYAEFLKEKSLAWNMAVNLLDNTDSKWFDIDTTKNKIETYQDIVVQSFKETIYNLSSEYGDDIENWQWKNTHIFTLTHPIGAVKLLAKLFNLNRGPYGVSGSHHTVCPYTYPFGVKFDVNHGASERHIFDVGNWDNSFTVIPTGNSGIPASKYYCDQTNLYLSGYYHKDYVTIDMIKKNAKYKMKILP